MLPSHTMNHKAANNKHPNRQPKARKNCFAAGEFDHLKKGRIYKVSFKNFDERHRTQFGSDPVLKNPSLFVKENQIGWVTHGDMVVYLETVRSGRDGFLKIVINDQIGYIYCTNEISLKRVTSRMLRRLEEKNEPSNRENL